MKQDTPDSERQAVVDRAEIERRLPHTGAMCLISAISDWDADGIVCHAAPPGRGHPLAAPAAEAGEGTPWLNSTVTVEYAAQAVALHASLVDGTGSGRSGMLAKLADVSLAPRPVHGAMTIEARRIASSQDGCLYSFDVADKQGRCSSGRLMIAFSP